VPRVAVLLALGACTADAVDPIAVRVEEVSFPVIQPRQLDLVFVIEDSPTMAPLQPTLLANYPGFVDALATIQGGLPSVQVAVATTSLAFRGPLVDVRFADGSRERNFDGSLADAFTTLADVGSNGSAVAQPLEAMRRALLVPGFVRENARLAVIFVAASDDASPAAAEDYERELRATKQAVKDIYLGAALRVDTPRLHAFVESFPDRNVITSLDQEDLTGAMDVFGELITSPLGNPCMHAALAEPLDCAVEYVFPDGAREALALCDGVRVPCWQVLADPVQCPQQLGGRLAITHARVVLPEHTVVVGQCLAR
jgi:hypothetical protein